MCAEFTLRVKNKHFSSYSFFCTQSSQNKWRRYLYFFQFFVMLHGMLGHKKYILNKVLLTKEDASKMKAFIKWKNSCILYCEQITHTNLNIIVLILKIFLKTFTQTCKTVLR